MLIRLLAPLIKYLIVTSPTLARQVEYKIREALPTLPAVRKEQAGDHCYHGKSMVVAIRWPKSLLTGAEDLGEFIKVINVVQTLCPGEIQTDLHFPSSLFLSLLTSLPHSI
jgi:hypothetical protein